MSTPAAIGQGSRKDLRRNAAQSRQQLAQQLRPLQREMTQAEQRLAALQAERAALEQELIVARDAARIAECGRRIKGIGDEEGMVEARWLELASQIEALQAG